MRLSIILLVVAAPSFSFAEPIRRKDTAEPAGKCSDGSRPIYLDCYSVLAS